MSSLLAVLIIAGLGPLCTVAWKLIDTNREALKTAHQQMQHSIASSMRQEVDIHIDGLRNELTRVARSLGPTLTSRGIRRESTAQVLADGVNGWLLFLRYSDFWGAVADSQPTDSTPPELERRLEETVREAQTRWSEGAEPGARIVSVSEPFRLENAPEHTLLVLAAPVMRAERLRGVVSAVVDLQSLWDTVLAGHSSGHTVIIVDASGRSFGSSDPRRARPGEVLSDSEIVQRFLLTQGRTTETLPFVWHEDNREVRYLGSYERTQEGWGVFVLAQEREVYAPVRAMVRDTLSWAAVALGVAMLAAVFFSGTLSTPINRLAAASRSFTAGDFSARVRIRSRNEIGELADVFNRMAAKIEDDIRELKRAAEENDELFMGTIRAMAQAIDAKDPYTRGHSARVNKYSMIIARYLGLGEPVLRDVHVSSLMHDVGKIGVDDSILKKPGALTPEEFAVMKSHTVVGASIMSPIRQMTRIIPGLRSHHERMNGQGYPDGLAGDQIPLMARIIAVADTFDAMTTHRPYQRASSFDAARARINELRKVAFDERVVDAFNQAYQAGEFEAERAAEEPAAAESLAAS